MTICMPTAGGNGLAATLFDHFGSAPYFTIYDTDTGEVRVLENTNLHHSHGACRPLSLFADRKIDAVLTSGMGKRAVHLLNESGVKVYLQAGITVKEAVNNFQNERLQELTVDSACGGHGAGHGCH